MLILLKQREERRAQSLFEIGMIRERELLDKRIFEGRSISHMTGIVLVFFEIVSREKTFLTAVLHTPPTGLVFIYNLNYFIIYTIFK